MSIALVIIGRNQSPYLQTLVGCLKQHPFDEIIYVDSDSTDESVAVARSAGWQVAVLLPASVRNAAAGRHVGTRVAQSDWILYIDGDMAPDLSTVKRWIGVIGTRDPGVVGMTGDIIDIFGPEARRIRPQKSQHGEQAIWFGGAVLLNRQAVLRAGNWNPDVFAEEEWDLDARLRRQGGRVLYIHDTLVDHHTTAAPTWQVVLRLLSLYDYRNPRNGGAGYVVRSAAQSGSLSQVFAVRPEFFVLPLGTLVLVIIGIISNWLIALAGLGALFAWTTIRRGPQYIPVCYLGVVQMLVGVLRYRHYELLYQVLEA